MNDPRDLQVLHKIVCANYGEWRKDGGRADSPYLPFFLQFQTALNSAKRNGANVSPTIVVVRDDGTQGEIDLVEMFREMGYLE